VWERALPAATVVLALVVRVVSLPFQPWVTVDGTEYIRFADALAQGRLFSSIFPPGYPALIALARLLTPDRVQAAAWVSVLCGALLPLPVAAIAGRAVGRRWGALAALVVAIHPALIEYSIVTMSESAYVLALWAALAWASAERPVPTGLAAGAAFAIRPEALVPAAALVVREAVRRPRATALPRVALVLGGFLLLAAPCWGYFRITRGEWTLTPKLGAFHVTSQNWRVLEHQLGRRDSEPATYGVEQMLSDLPGVLARAPGNALVHARSVLHFWPVPLFLLSVIGFVRRRGVESLALLHLVALPLLGLSGQPRFVLCVVPTLAILAVAAVAWPANRLLRLGAAALLVGGLTWSWIRLGEEIEFAFDGYLGADRQAGLWLADNSDPADPVMDRKPFIAFYARRPYRVTPDLSADSIIAVAQQTYVRYLVVDEGVSRLFRKQLLPLLYDKAFRDARDRLEAVYVGGHFKGYGLAIFRVLQPGEPRSGLPPVNTMSMREPPESAKHPIMRGLTPAR
jgi:hypothetical protein